MRYLTLIFCAAFIFLVAVKVQADDDTSLIIEQELAKYDFSAWDINEDGISVDARKMTEDYIEGNSSAAIESIGGYVMRTLGKAFLGKLPLVLFLLAASLVSGLSSALIPEEKSDLKPAVDFLSTAVCIGSIFAVVLSCIRSAITCIDRACAFTEAATPVIALFMTASGRKGTEAVFSPAIAYLSSGTQSVMRTVVLPLIIAGILFAVINALGGNGRAKRVFSLTKSSLKWLFGLITAVFTGILSVYGIGAKAHDSLALKTAKYVADKSIPGAGGLISGTADTLLECANALKTATGATFIVIVVIILSSALFEIAATVFALRISAALSGIVSDGKTTECIDGAADMLKYLFAAVAVVNLLLIITVGLCACVL